MRKGLSKSGLLLLAGLSAAMILSGCGAQKKGAVDFISASFHGINSKGTMTLSFDRDALEEEITAKKKLTEREKETLDSLLSGIEKDYILSKKDGLSNGDEVEITGGLDKNLLKDYGIVFDNNSVKVTVEGLADSVEINIGDFITGYTDGFEGGGSFSLSIDGQGITEAVTAQAASVEGKTPDEIKLNEEIQRCLSSLTVNPWSFYELSTGDKVHAELEMTETEIPEYGITFKAEDYEETVSGFAPYEAVSLSDYMTPALYGYDTFGTAYASLDTEKLANDLAAVLKKDNRASTGRAGSDTDFDEEARYMAGKIESTFRNSFEVTLSASENLKNGDKIEISGTPYESAADESGEVRISSIGVTLTGGSTETEVKGLLGTAEIDLSDYISLSFNGYEGAGSAEAVYDEEGFKKALDTLICSQDPSINPADFSYSGGSFLTRSATNAQELTSLENGDEVSVEVIPYAESLPEYGILFKASPVEGKVEGLTPTQEIDLADAVNVTFTGICPFVNAVREVDRDFPVYYDTSLSEIYGSESITAENGDTYELKITYDRDELLKKGYVVTNDTAAFTISGLNTWTLGLENADDERLSEYQSLAEERAWAEFNSDAGNIAGSLAGNQGWVVWEDTALETQKVWYGETPADRSYGNELCFTGEFSVPVRNADRTVAEKTVGYAAWIRNVTQNPSGSLESENDLRVRLYYSGEDCEEELRNSIIYELGEGADILVMEMPEETSENGAESISESAVEEPASAGETQEMQETAETGEPEEEADPDHPEWTKLVKQAVSPVYADPATAAKAYGEPVVLDGHVYYQFSKVRDTPFTWTQAKLWCEEAGGHLATISSYREQCALNYLLKDREKTCFWIGASDKESEGDWKWVTGEPFSYTYWRNDGQPDNYEGRENYLALYMDSDGRWNDLTNEDESPGFILEMEPEESSDIDENAVSLAELTPALSEYQSVWQYVKDPYGNCYFESLAYDAGNRAVSEHDLGGRYESLAFTLSTSEETDSEASMDILIYGDRKLLFAVYGYTRSDAPVSVEISLSGVNRLSVQTASRGSSGKLFLNDAYLASAESGTEKCESYLSDLNIVYSADAEAMLISGVQTDISGNLLRDALKLYTGNQGEVVWRIKETAQNFSAYLSMGSYPNYENDPAVVEFYGDDTLLGKYTLSAYDGMVPVEFDLSGIRLLSVKARNRSVEGLSQQVIISDICIAENPSGEVPGLPAPIFPEIDPEYEQKAAAVLTTGNYRYYRFDEPVPNDKVRMICQEAGGTPAVIKNAEQNAAVGALIAGGNWDGYDGYWIGCTYDQEGRFWHWDDDTALLEGDYQNWSEAHEAGNDRAQRYMIITRDGTWNTDVANSKRGFIMQVKADDALLPEGGVNLTSLESTAMEYAEALEYVQSDGKYLTYMPGTIRLDAGASGYAEYPLSGRYRAMTARFETTPDTDINSWADFAVFGDGVLLYSASEVSRSSEPCSFMVDLTGVQNLKIMSSSDADSRILLEEAVIYPAEGAERREVNRLSGLTVVDSRGMDSTNCLVRDIYGGYHDSAIMLDASEEGFVLYNLEGRYTSLSFDLVSTGETQKYGTRTVKILLDGETVYEETHDGYLKTTEPFTFDVTGKSTLRIETEPAVDGRDFICLTDDRLI